MVDDTTVSTTRTVLSHDAASYTARALAAAEQGDAAELARCLRFAADSASLAVRLGATPAEVAEGAARARAEATTPKPAPAGDRNTEGCPPWCALDHKGADGYPGWHWSTPDVVTAPNSLGAPVTLLTGRVAVRDGQDTPYLAIDGDDGDIAELDEKQAEQLHEQLSKFVPMLAAVAMVHMHAKDAR